MDFWIEVSEICLFVGYFKSCRDPAKKEMEKVLKEDVIRIEERNIGNLLEINLYYDKLLKKCSPHKG